MTTTDELSPPAVDRALTVVTTVAVVVGIALRFAPRSALWLDEALTVNISTLPIGDIGGALERDGHPPLFYWMLHVWTAVGGTSDWWVRALAGVISVLALPLTYLAGRRVAERVGAGPLGVRRTGLIALTIMAVMPYGVRYGAETRMYSLATMLVVAGYLLVDDLLLARSSGRRRLAVTAGAAVVTAALLWTHYWSMWLLAAVGLLALWCAVRGNEPGRRAGGRLLAAAMVIGGLLFLPWVPSLLFQAANTGTPWGEVFGPIEVATATIQDFSGDTLSSYLAVAFVLLAAVAVVGTLVAVAVAEGGRQTGGPRQEVVVSTSFQPRIRTELAVLVATIGIGWAASAISSNTYSSRYAAVVHPLYVLCIAAGVAVIRRPRATVGALVVFLLLSTYASVATLREDRTQAGQIGDRIAEDLAATGGAAVVISCPDQIGVALQRSLDADDVPLEVIPFPAGGDPRFIDWVDYGERNQASSAAEFFERISPDIPADATVYLAAMPGYQTFDGRCEELIARVAQERPVREQVDPADLGETMGLWIFGPRR